MIGIHFSSVEPPQKQHVRLLLRALCTCHEEDLRPHETLNKKSIEEQRAIEWLIRITGHTELLDEVQQWGSAQSWKNIIDEAKDKE